MSRFVIGDIHGNHRGLLQCLERSHFDKEDDLLITLGDICDGYSGVYECVEELLTIKNRIDIRGNHDDPFVDFLNTGQHPWDWSQGGAGTVKSYINNYHGNDEPSYDEVITRDGKKVITSLNPMDIPVEHQVFFQKQVFKYVDDDNNLFVHGGFNRHLPISGQHKDVLMWDRDFWMQALSFATMPGNVTDHPYKFKMKDKFKEVFLGHTTVMNWKTTEPMNAANVWNLDTGAGFAGKLTIMEIDTHQFWQSDSGEELYPDETGRRKAKA